MREKLFAIGDDFWVETEGGQRAFKVDGKALRVRSTFVLESPSGEELFKIQENKLRVRDTMTIEHNGDTVATVKKALVTPLRDRFSLTSRTAANSAPRATSSIMSTRSSAMATRSPRSPSWFRVRDTYGIEIVPGENDALILARRSCIDEMARH